MTVRAALAAGFFVGSADLSGDIGSMGSITTSQALQDTSPLNLSGTRRLTLRSDGEMSYSSFWNAAAGAAVPILRDLTTETLCTYIDSSTLGGWGATLTGLKVNFNTALGQDGSIAATGQVTGSAGRPVEWGRLLTIGKQTFASTQAISSWVANHAYALNDLVVPTSANGHYYKATTGGTSDMTTEPTWVTNGGTNADGTVVWTDQGLLPNGVDRGVGVSTSFGMAASLHAISIGSGSATVKVQDSANRISWADHITFTAITGATSQYKRTSSLTATVRRYIRVNVTGTFTNLVAVVVAVPYVTQQS